MSRRGRRQDSTTLSATSSTPTVDSSVSQVCWALETIRLGLSLQVRVRPRAQGAQRSVSDVSSLAEALGRCQHERGRISVSFNLLFSSFTQQLSKPLW